MIEAVNSTVQNVQVIRGQAGQDSAARSYAANPERLQEAANVPRAPYISPAIAVDVYYNTAVLQIRDSETGDVVRQFPTEPSLRARQASQAQEEGGEIFAQADEAPKVSRSADKGDAADAGASFSENSGVPQASAQVSAQAQVAVAALNAGARAGVESLSAGVSVVA
ncbi:MAG: hypothetical protein K9G62_04945 [Alphaproteobacteria bacterium]|nr:hypothetical protein [Alphaproteobacteria bacterium]